MRRLMILPIVHSRSDLGSLQFVADQAKVAALGISSADAVARSIDEFWSAVRQAIADMRLDYSRVVIYQDGLPVVANVSLQIEKRIVEDLARGGSPNHQLVQWMIDQGAILVGTESPELLVQEYNAVRRSLAQGFRSINGTATDASSADGTSEAAAAASTLLRQRDEFIARRIDQTLGNAQRGLLFLGMLHEIEPFLPSDIEVEYPVGRPQREKIKLLTGI
jgi:hypothetical protein